jgi:DNA-binding SARP family transcriptional activator
MLLLFGEPRLAFGEADGPGGRELPAGGKRLIAYAALHRGHLDRRHAAGALWPACDDVRAAGNLRSALWRLREAGLTVLEADKRQVWLHPGVTVDADQVAVWALRLIDGGPASDRDEATWQRSRPGLLPGWPDEWVGPHRERLRQRVLHAMEARARTLLAAGDPGRAVTAARLLAAAEPLRATAHRILAESLRAAGQSGAARTVEVRFRTRAGS